MEKKILIATILVMLSAGLKSCLSEESMMLPYSIMQPADLGDGWCIATPEEVGFDRDKLEQVFSNCHHGDAWQMRGMLVAKDGCLVGETYTKDAADIGRSHAVWSCTKQVLAIIVMMAIEQGSVPSLDATIGELLPGMVSKFPDKSGISLRQFMTMTSGISFRNDGLNGDTNKLLRTEPKNSVEYILGLPLAAGIPPYAFSYNDGDPQIVSAILGRAFGEDVGSWSRTRLFERMNISNYDWMQYPDGVTMGAFGLKLTPRDLLKFGQIIVDKGSWRGERIISPESVELLSSVHVDATGYQHQSFGLYWWINPDDSAVYMHGQGGQYVIADIRRHVVVCIVAEPNTQGASQLSLSKAFSICHSVLDALKV